MSDTIVGAIIGTSGALGGIVITFISQIAHYHWIEKGKLKKEREFNFHKDLYFYLQQKLEIIITSLEQDYLNIRYINPDKAIYFKEQDKIEIKESERTSLINIYFPELKKDLEKYEATHGNIVLLVNEGEFNGGEHPSDRYIQELKFYKEASNILKKNLYNLLENNKPN